MTLLTATKAVAWSLALWAIASTGEAMTLHVACGGTEGFTGIGAALTALKHQELSTSNTVLVTGSCSENVVIQTMDHVTLTAVNGASISDASGGTKPAIFIGDSRDVTVNGFTIIGGSDGIRCYDGSICRLTNNSVQNTRGAGIFVLTGSYATITGGALQGNTSFAGIAVINGARALVSQVTTSGNYYGAQVNTDSFLHFLSSSASGNLGPGISVVQGSSLVCGSCTVSGNGADGIDVAQSASLVLTLDFGAPVLAGYSITGNAGTGVSLTNLSGVSMPAAGDVSGNSGVLDIACNASFTTASNLANANLAPGRTNCTGP